MYTKEECNVLIQTISSKLVEESKNNQCINYPIYNCDEVVPLVEAVSSKSQEVVNTVQKEDYNTWRLDEVFSLMNNCYDARNFGRMKKPKLSFANEVCAEMAA